MQSKKNILFFMWAIFTTVQKLPLVTSLPHIIHIVADDYGWNDVGFRNSAIHTPRIDNLAKKGVVLDSHYVFKYCSPTRSMVLTGRYPMHNGLWHGNLPIQQYEGVPLSFLTIADELAAAGYSTHAIGKWHQGMSSAAYTPTRRGFKTFFGFYQGMEDHWSHGIHVHHNISQIFGFDIHNDTAHRPITPPSSTYNCTYASDLYSEEATRIILSHDIKIPLYMYLAFQASHGPNQAPQEYIDIFQTTVRHYGRRIFSGMVLSMDYAIGRIVDVLKKKKMWNRTVIIFHADNGGELQEAGNNMPWRGGKFTYWEGGTRVTSFLSGGYVHQSLFNRGSYTVEIDGLIHYSGLLAAVDWYPTLCRLAGIDTPRGNVTHGVPPLDGFDVWNAIMSNSVSPRTEHVYNIDCKKAMSMKNCHDANETLIGAIRDSKGLKLLVGSPGPAEKSAIQNIPNWIDPDEKKRLPFGKCSSADQGIYIQVNTTIDTWGQKCSLVNPCLFDLINDPTESNNIASDRPHDTTRLINRFIELSKTQFRLLNTTSNSSALLETIKKTGFYMPWAE